MKDKILDIDQPMIKTGSGLLLDHTTAGIAGIGVDVNKKLKTEAVNKVYEEYESKRKVALEAPVPDIKLPYSFVLTRAVPPKMIGNTEAGIMINKLDVDDRTLARLAIMTDHVSDFQEVLLRGFNVDEKVCAPGDMVRIDFRRFRTLNDDHTAGVIETSYEDPVHNIDGHDYLIIDARDIIYAKTNKDGK